MIFFYTHASPINVPPVFRRRMDPRSCRRQSDKARAPIWTHRNCVLRGLPWKRTGTFVEALGAFIWSIICIYTYTYIHTYIYMHIYIYVCIDRCIHMMTWIIADTYLHIAIYNHIHIKYNYTNRYRLFWVLRIQVRRLSCQEQKKLAARSGLEKAIKRRDINALMRLEPIFTWKSHGNPYVIEGIFGYFWVLHVISDLVNNHGHDGHESKKTYNIRWYLWQWFWVIFFVLFWIDHIPWGLYLYIDGFSICYH